MSEDVVRGERVEGGVGWSYQIQKRGPLEPEKVKIKVFGSIMHPFEE